MKQFLMRCSSLHAVMSDPKLKADKDAGKLSEGAKTEIHAMVRRYLYDYDQPELGNKEIRKGREMETGAIRLLSNLSGEFYQKNETRITNDYLTGEADIVHDDHGRDTKCPWSIEQFPMVKSHALQMAVKAGYEWQCRGYMHLYDKPRWAVDYCLMETPSELIPPWELESDIHGIPLMLPIEHRVTTVWFERDLELEAKIVQKCKAAQAYAQELIEAWKLEKQA